MIISLCMIVKNEEEYIQKCLSSVSDSVDEIVIVDTGSVDGTIEICKSFGAKIFQYEWTEDFSVARNFGIKKAKGDWILVLDADEYLDRTDAGRLRDYVTFLKKEGYLGSFMIRYDYFKNGSWDEADIIRLFARSDSNRYKGAVYESVRIKKDKVFIDRNFPMKIHHSGFLKPSDVTLNKRKNYKKITENSLWDAEIKNKLIYWEAQNMLIYGETDEAIDICKVGIEECPESKRLVELLGRLYIQGQDYDNAEKCFLKVIELAEEEKKLRPYEESKFHTRALNDMVELLYLKGDYAQALKIIDQNIEKEPSACSYINKAMILLKIDEKDAAGRCMEQALRINSVIAEVKCGEKDEFSCLARTFQVFEGYDRLLRSITSEVKLK